MKKIVFICPYFGNLPREQMNLFLKSCSYNKDYDFIIIKNDKTEFKETKNVKFINYSFKEIIDIFQSKFSFKLKIENPYKLCDFKPAYGYIFSELIKEYEYWGYCDISDIVLGDLNKFINYNEIKKYDKINFLGHLTLFKNIKEVNERIFIQCNNNYTIKDILGNCSNMAFDENMTYGINKIYLDNNFSQVRKDSMYSDIAPKYYNFREAKSDINYNFYYPKIKYIYKWNKGKLFKFYIKNKKVISEEIGYCHYQKRKMNYTKLDFNADSFIIVPNKFISFNNDITKKIVLKYTKNKIYIQGYKLMFKNLKKRIIKYIDNISSDNI